MRPYALRKRWARLRRSRLVVCATTVTLAAGLAGYAISGATAATGPPDATARSSAAGSAGGAVSFNAATGTTTRAQQQPRPQSDVTLITGDRAELATAPDGQQTVNPVPVAVGRVSGQKSAAVGRVSGQKSAGKRAARGSSGFAEFTAAGDEYLVPDEAAAYLASGVLDPRLFDVSYLAQAAFGSALPVQVSYTGTAVPSLPGLHVSHAADGVADGTLSSAQALPFGRLLASTQAAAMTRHIQTGRLPGITRISLAPPSGAPPLPALPSQLTQAGQPAAATGPAATGPAQPGLAYHTLTLNFKAPDGTAGTAIGFVQNVDDSSLSPGLLFGAVQGSFTLSVPAGTYSAEFSIITPDSGTYRGYDAALVVNPQFTVTSDTTITLDASTTVPYHVTLSGITAPPVQTDELGFERTSVTGPASESALNGGGFYSYLMDLFSVSGDGYAGSQLSASPTAAVTRGTLGFQGTAWLSAAPAQGGGGGAQPNSTYFLNFPSAGRIPSSLSYTVWRRALTANHENLYANPLGTCGNSDLVSDVVYQPAAGAVAIWQFDATPGGSRTDYWYDADPRLDFWQPALYPADCSTSGPSLGLADAPRQIRQGGQVTENWDKAPLTAPPPAAPAFEFDTGDQSQPLLTLCPACRQGSNAFLTLTPYGDSDPAHQDASSAISLPASSLNFYRDGKLAVTSAASCEVGLSSGQSDCDMVPQGLELPLLARAARYRLDWSYLDWSYDTVATTTLTWGFRSAPDAAAGKLPDGERCAPDSTQGCSYLPLLFIGYDLALNYDGQAPAGQSFPVTFTVTHQQGEAPPSGVSATVSASFDNGTTWTTPQAAARLGGGRFAVAIQQPALSDTNGFVSLRVTARDSAGDSVTETLIKAYGLTS